MSFKRREKSADDWEAQGAKRPVTEPERPEKGLHVRFTRGELAELGRLALVEDTSKQRLVRRIVRERLRVSGTGSVPEQDQTGTD